MAHTYMVFDFGSDEDKAQQALHKLQGWKQAFRLDKKLQFKLDRADLNQADATEAAEPEETPKPKPKAKAKSGKAGAEKTAVDKNDADKNVEVKLLVRLYFSSHEKLSEQQWFDRIPADELFKEASPKVIKEGDKEFSDIVDKFDSIA